MASSTLLGGKPARPLAVANDGVLPTELLCDVLLRLPADVLCRLRQACRSWRSLTSEPHFARAHALRHPLVGGLDRSGGEIRFTDLSGNVVKRMPLVEKYCSRYPLLSWQLDMLCVSSLLMQGKETRAYVLDTATGAMTVLPGDIPVDDPESVGGRVRSCSFALGHVPSTGEFKVLRFHSRQDHGTGHNNHGRRRTYRRQTCDIITLGDGDGGGRWRTKSGPPFGGVRSNNGHNDTVINGIAYFMVSMNLVEDSAEIKLDDVAAFDLAAEEWRSPLIKGPLSSNRDISYNPYTDNIRMTILDGCLVVTILYNGQHCFMDLWFLLDVSRCIWTKRYSVQFTPRLGWLQDSTPYPLVVLDDEVVVWDGFSLKTYDIGTRTWTRLASIQGFFYVRKHDGNLLRSGSSELGPA